MHPEADANSRFLNHSGLAFARRPWFGMTTLVLSCSERASGRAASPRSFAIFNFSLESCSARGFQAHKNLVAQPGVPSKPGFGLLGWRRPRLCAWVARFFNPKVVPTSSTAFKLWPKPRHSRGRLCHKTLVLVSESSKLSFWGQLKETRNPHPAAVRLRGTGVSRV